MRGAGGSSRTTIAVKVGAPTAPPPTAPTPLRSPPIIFLDIDGVLNSQASRRAGGDALEQGELPTFESQLPTADMLALLAEIARSSPLRIVLSSTWRCKPDTRAAVVESLRTVGLELSGDTPELEALCRGDRVDEILACLSVERPPWVVLDDMDLLAMNTKLADANFVRTDDAVGLTRAKADEAIAKLHAQRDTRR